MGTLIWVASIYFVIAIGCFGILLYYFLFEQKQPMKSTQFQYIPIGEPFYDPSCEEFFIKVSLTHAKVTSNAYDDNNLHEFNLHEIVEIED